MPTTALSNKGSSWLPRHKTEGTLPRVKVHTDLLCSFALFLLQVPDRLAAMAEKATTGWEEARFLLPSFPLENPGIWSDHRRTEDSLWVPRPLITQRSEPGWSAFLG